ncbi:MAG: non-heme iron oxygenase ferredoxin subunit [bacterium]
MSQDFIRVAKTTDIKEGKTLRVKVADRNVLIANVQGTLYAVDDMCTHEDSSLYLGCLKGYEVECSLHGATFDVRTGEPRHEPAEIPIATYELKVEDDEVLIKPA